VVRQRPLDRDRAPNRVTGRLECREEPVSRPIDDLPECSEMSALSVWSCQRRRCSQASSPIASARLVELTMSVKKNVLRTWTGVASR
jgi:hypothetical protein